MVDEFKLKADILKLANLKVFTADGAQLVLGRVWKNQTVILIFLRHFACLACRAHASSVWAAREQYEKGGAKVVFIGNGAPEFIKTFKEDLKLEGSLVLTDPSLESFRAAGFRHGFQYIVHPKSIVAAVKLLKEGHRQTSHTKEAGVHQQMGGVLAVSKTGQVLYQYISEFFGDFPEEPYVDIIRADESKETAVET